MIIVCCFCNALGVCFLYLSWGGGWFLGIISNHLSDSWCCVDIIQTVVVFLHNFLHSWKQWFFGGCWVFSWRSWLNVNFGAGHFNQLIEHFCVWMALVSAHVFIPPSSCLPLYICLFLLNTVCYYLKDDFLFYCYCYLLILQKSFTCNMRNHFSFSRQHEYLM